MALLQWIFENGGVGGLPSELDQCEYLPSQIGNQSFINFDLREIKFTDNCFQTQIVLSTPFELNPFPNDKFETPP